MIEVIKEIVEANKHGRFMKCGIDTLIRIDKKKCFIDCNDCIFKDIEADILMCPHRYSLAQEVK